MNKNALICGMSLVAAIVLIVLSAATDNPACLVLSCAVAAISAFFALKYSRQK